MGIFDFFKQFQENRNKEKRVQEALLELRKMENTADYREGIIKSFHVLEALGTEYLGIKRGEATTAREYVRLLEEDGIVRKDELKELVTAFEVSKYSPFNPTLENYNKAKSMVFDMEKRFKNPNARKAKTSKKGKRKGRKRAAPRSGASGESPRRPKRRVKKRAD